MDSCYCDAFPRMVRCASVKNAMLSADENRPLLRTLLQREFWGALKEYAGTMKQCTVCRPPSCEANESGLGDEGEEEEEEDAPVILSFNNDNEDEDSYDERAEEEESDDDDTPQQPKPTCFSGLPTTSTSAAPKSYNMINTDITSNNGPREAGFSEPGASSRGGVPCKLATHCASASDAFLSPQSPYISCSLSPLSSTKPAQPVYC
jgi:hypothetical protein